MPTVPTMSTRIPSTRSPYPIPPGHYNNGEDIKCIPQGSSGHGMGYTLDLEDRQNLRTVNNMIDECWED